MAKAPSSRPLDRSIRSLCPEALECRVMMSADVGVVLSSLIHSEPSAATDVLADAHLFSTHFVADHGLTLDGGAVIFEDGLSVTGDLIVSHASSVTFKGNVEVTGNIIIDGGAGIVFSNGVWSGGGVALAGDEIDFLGGLDSAHIAGDLVLQTHSAARDIQLGFSVNSTGSLGLTDADLAAVHAGGKLVIGAGDAGAVTIESADIHNDLAVTGSAVTVESSLLAKGSHVNLSSGTGVVRNDGLIDVSANSAAGIAGDLEMSGRYVGNFGTILGLGSANSAGGNVKMSSTLQTLVSSAAVIDVSGGTHGGTVTLWSDANTTMAGKLIARGGAAGGNGGFVEVSSAGGFSLTGVVDTTAVAGKTGHLLIDPKNVIIAGASPSTLVMVDQFSDTPGTDVTIAASTLAAASTAVTIQANNDITVNAAVSMNQDLTLQAGRSVIINQDIALTNKTLTIIANDDAGVDANRDAGNGSITTISGVTLSAGNGTINLTVETGDVGPAGGITIDKVVTSGTLNISTAGFLRETAGDALPSAGAMTSDDDLTAGTLNLIATATDATFGEPLDQGNGAIEVAAGVINTDVQLPGAAPASNFVGYFVLTDADHTNGSPGGNNPVVMNAPMTIGTINAGSGSVILTAKGASILGTAGGTPNIIATQVNLTTDAYAGPDGLTHYGAIGSLVAPIRTDIGMLTATASDAGIFISEANSLMVNKIVVQDKGVTPQTGSNGAVVIQPSGQSAVDGTSDALISAGGDMTILDLKVADQLTLNAGGLIADGNQDTANILARGLVVNTGAAFGNASDTIETTVMTLQATTTNGGVFVTESDGVNISSITAGGTGNGVMVTSGAGSIVLGAITANGGDVSVNAQFDAITDGNGAAANVVAGSVSLTARTTLGASNDPLEVNVGGLTTKVLNSGAGTYLSNAGTTTALSLETNNGPVGVTLSGGSVSFVQPGSANQLSLSAPSLSTFSFSNAGGSIAVNSINAGTGAVSLSAKTSIEDHANDSVLDITGGTLTLKAGTFIGTATNPLETNIDVLTAAADAGGIFISDSGSINSVTAAAKGAGNDVTVSTVGDLVVAKISAPDAITLTAGGAGNLLRSGNVLNVSGASATLHAGGAIGTPAEPLLVNTATLSSAIADTGGLFMRAKGAITANLVQAPNGDIDFTSEGNVTLGLLEAGNGHSAKVTSTYGSILDGNAGAVNVRAGAATLSAVAIGTANDPLDTDVTTLTATGTSGGVFINELNDVTVTRLEAQGLGSDVVFTAGGNIILGVAKAEGDKVNIRSIGGSITDGNGSALNITADQLDIAAPGGIGALQNSVNKLGSANGGASGVTISNIGALAITDATLEGKGAGLLTIQADSITILDMADNVASLDPNGSVQLVTTGNVVFLDPNDTIQASGNGSITINAGLGSTPAYPDTGAVAVIGNLKTAGGNIDVEANHHITIGLLDAGGTGNVKVASETGVIIDGNGAANNIVGNVVTLSGTAVTTRQAQLETSIRIADYSAIRSEAAAKLTDAQSLATATAIMQVQAGNALNAKNDAEIAVNEAEQAKDSADTAALAAYITATVLDGVATALGIARDIVAIPAGAAQAIPLTGDGGAMTGYSALDVAANVADVAAYAAGIVSDQLGDIAEEKANELVQASAESTALSATYQDSLSTYKAFDEATSIAQKAADAAAIARDHALVVRDQAIHAEDQVNVIGTNSAPLGIQAHEINATSTDGSVFLAATGDFGLGGVSATGANGTVSIQATGNIYVSGTTQAPTQVTLNAGGSIIDAGGSIVAPTFLGLAQGAVGSVANPIHTTVEHLAVKAQGGSVGILETDTLEIGSVDGVLGVTAAGPVGLTSSGSLTLKNAVVAPGQVVNLASQNGAIIDAHTGGADVSALTLNVSAASGIEADTAIASLTASVTGAGSMKIRDVDALTITSAQTTNGAISIDAGGSIVAASVISQTDADTNDLSLKTAGGDIQLGTISAGSTFGDVTLEAFGQISMLGGGRVTADVITASAASGVSLVSAAKLIDLSVTNAGGITVDELDSLTVKSAHTANGSIDLTTGGAVALMEGAVNAGSGSGNVTVHAGGAITGPLSGNDSAEITGAVVSLVTTGVGGTIGASLSNALEVNATSMLNAQTQNSDAFITDIAGGVVVGLINTGLGDTHLKALAGGIAAQNEGDGTADIVAAHVDLTVTGANSRIGSGEGSEFDINGSTLTVKTAGGSAYLTDTAGGIGLNTLDVGAGDLFLSAQGGAITDNDGGAANNIVATKLMLSATAGIGTASDALEVKVTSFEGAGGAGGVAITDLEGGIQVGGVSFSKSGVTATGGDISITALSPLTVNEPVTNSGGGNITLKASDTAATGEDLTINADVTIAGGNGKVRLLGGDHVTVSAGVSVTTNGTVEIRGDDGNADVGTGSHITLDGAIRADRLEITTDADDDTIIVRDAVVNSHSISTGDGADDITITSGNSLGSGTIDAGAGNDTLTSATTLNNFIGAEGDDRILIKAGASFSGTVSGGVGYDTLVYDHDAMGSDDFAGPVTVNLETQSATGVASFSGLDRIEATNHANDHLIGANTTNTWHVTGTNAGDIGGAGTFDFSGFEHLTGGTADDTFQFAAGGSLSGNLNGGGHTVHDSIDYNSADYNGGVSLTLDSANGGTATAIGGRFDQIDQVIGDGDKASLNALTGDNAANVWTFTGTNTGHINGQFFFQNFGDITGGNGGNTFAFGDHSVPAKPVKGGTGNNTLDLSGWTGDLGWQITNDNAGTITTADGSFEFSGMSKLVGGSGSDRFTFSDDKILGGGLGAPGALDGGAGIDFIDASAYKTRNEWTRINTDGTISTDRGAWSYSSVEQFLGSQTTTFRFDVVDFTGAITKTVMPAQMLPMQGGGVYMTITNLGNDEALKESINVSFYLSADDKLDAGDILIGVNDGRGINLYQGKTTAPFFTATQVPAGTAPGVYHLLSLIDSGDVVHEGDETNNLVQGGSVEVLPVQVDLQASVTKSTLPATVLPGAKGAITTVVKNIGNSPATGLADVQFYLSHDGTVDAGDIALGGFSDVSLNLAAGASKTFTFNAQVPTGTASGDYQVLALVDGKNAILESDETNNTAAAAAGLHVNAPFVDLVGHMQNAKLPDIAVPNDVITFQLPIKNLGTIATNGKIDIDFYLSTDQTASPGTDVFLKSLHNVAVKLAPNGEMLLSGSATVPSSILGGTFYVVADIDSTHHLTEGNELNNSASSDNAMEVVWRFGNFGGRRGVKLVVPDANGTMVTFSMTGEGAGDVLGGSAFTELSLVGTNALTKVNIATKGGAPTTLHNVTSTNALDVFNAPKANLVGDFLADGVVHTINLGDVSGGSTITLGARALDTERVSVNLGHVENASIVSATPIHLLSVKDWQDSDATRDFLQVPRVTILQSAGDLNADIVAVDALGATYSLHTLMVKGSVNSTMSLPSGASSMDVGKLTNSTIDSLFVDSLLVRKDMTGTTLNVSGPNDIVGKPALGSLRVMGAVSDSTIDVAMSAGSVQVGQWGAGSVLAVGVDDGGDGTFFDGNETAIGGTLGAFSATKYVPQNGGQPFGIIVDALAKVVKLGSKTLTPSTLPFADGDLEVVVI